MKRKYEENLEKIQLKPDRVNLNRIKEKNMYIGRQMKLFIRIFSNLAQIYSEQVTRLHYVLEDCSEEIWRIISSNQAISRRVNSTKMWRKRNVLTEKKGHVYCMRCRRRNVQSRKKSVVGDDIKISQIC